MVFSCQVFLCCLGDVCVHCATLFPYMVISFVHSHGNDLHADDVFCCIPAAVQYVHLW